MKKLLLIFVPFLIFACTKAPENTSISDKYDTVEKKVRDENRGICGNGIIEADEECDFSGIISCSEYKNSKIGPLECIDCVLSAENCVDSDQCGELLCFGNGTCYEDVLNFNIGCDCNPNMTENCSECRENYHLDLDGGCISDSKCTEVGCEYEHSECKINEENQAYCECTDPWIGDECDECDMHHYLEDGECKGRYCSNSDIECTEYEMCSDVSSKPVCICLTSTQDPQDCSKCIKDYTWLTDFGGEVCANSKTVSCKPDPDRPENSENIYKSVTVTYTDENGWTTPEPCEWPARPMELRGRSRVSIIVSKI